MASLAIIKIKQAIARTTQDARELVGETNGVMYTKVHPHAAERIIDVRGIAREQDTAIAVVHRNTLMHRVKVGVEDGAVDGWE